MWKRAKSPTDSEEAAALVGVSCPVLMSLALNAPVAVDNAYPYNYQCAHAEILIEPNRLDEPRAAKRSTSAQSKPAPADAKILHDAGIRGMSSLSQRPISPPVFQKGLKMAANSPHRFPLSPLMNSSLWRSSKDGRTTVKSFENLA
jgi:hypothetical protein